MNDDPQITRARGWNTYGRLREANWYPLVALLSSVEEQDRDDARFSWTCMCTDG